MRMPITGRDKRAADMVLDGLLHLYDPPALAVTFLSRELQRRGALPSPDSIYDLLLSALDKLKPAQSAPQQSSGWRRHRYVQLRYVDCVNHEAVAADLEISLRQASRVRLEALQALAALLLPDLPPSTRQHSAPDPAGNLSHDPRVSVSEVVRSVADTLARAAPNARLHLEISDSLPLAAVDRVSLRQIFLNLEFYLARARTLARPLGGTDLHVSVRAESDGEHVIVDIQAGEPPAMESAGRHRDLGIEQDPAIAVAAQLAQQQGIEIEELAGEESSLLYRVRIPIAQTRTILVVDDNPDIGEMFRLMLAGSTYHPVHVRTAPRAVVLARDTVPSAIVLDIVMPLRDGWEIQASLQRDPRTAGIPIIICSVLPDRELALSLGAAAFLAKPITRSSLRNLLDRLFAEGPG